MLWLWIRRTLGENTISQRKAMGKLKPPCSAALLFLSLLLFCFPSSQAQQLYENNVQLNCSLNGSSTLGYSCNGQRNSCSTFLTFRSQTPYQSPVDIGYLLNADASNISTINGVTDVSNVPDSDLVLIPVACSCSGDYYQHNASYTLKSTIETYFIVANDTYQGLSTCQALIAQNHYNSRNLSVGDKLVVPLRCACPTANQTAHGFKYLLTYLVTWGDDVSAIAKRFGADSQSVLDANGLSSSSVIYPFTTLLVPLKTEPSEKDLVNPPPPPPSPPPPPPTDKGGSSNRKWVYIGIGIGASLLAVSGILAWFLCWHRPKRKPIPQAPKIAEDFEKSSDAFVSSEIRNVIDSLTLYKFQELERATGSFGEDHRIKGSVYRAVISGDKAAVKRLKGDVSNEIGILKRVNHSNVIRLSGFCLHQGNTYLVYEFAERGSLSDWLHQKKDWSGSSLGWRQRIQIAHDVADGLNYLHNYTNPPYVHKNLKSSNILLDSEFKAKLSNFGLARPVEDWEGPHLTRHVVGTQGYLAPEYLEHGLITPKLDVFAFGVVMLELLSGKEATFAKEGDEKKEVQLWALIGEVLSGEDVRVKLRSLVDPYLQNDYPFDLAFALAELAMRCVARDPASRPTMTDVFVSLTAIYNSTLDWDPSDFTNSRSTVRGR